MPENIQENLCVTISKSLNSVPKYSEASLRSWLTVKLRGVGHFKHFLLALGGWVIEADPRHLLRLEKKCLL